MRKMLGAAVVLTLTSLALTGVALAAGRPGVLRTNDGTIYDGAIEESAENAVVTVHGIETTVSRGNIASITYGDFETRWKDSYAKLAPTDAAGRVAAGRRAFDQGRLDLADQAARDALAIDPNNSDAGELSRLITNQRHLERAQPEAAPTPRAAPPVELNGQMKQAGVWATLTPQQINRIKQYELRDADGAILRFAFDNDVRKKFYESNPRLSTTYRSYGEFLREPPFTQAMMIIKGGDELAKDVRIVNDPSSIVAFRRDVLPLVLSGCATSGCHGGNNAAADKFALISPGVDPASVYTNFYVLSGTRVKQVSKMPGVSDDKSASSMAPLFDRSHPELSGLLQYGLPAPLAEAKHPTVRGYNGVFRSRDDARYQAVLGFVNSLAPITPEYGINFKMERSNLPEVKNPATLPAGAP